MNGYIKGGDQSEEIKPKKKKPVNTLRRNRK